ncbi:FAD-dependent oxidoreductase [Almyronema epifaneia]|uniref:FAD-dependent oxidoreductase n=1 Tax=Almyronema epifaneia S1 TaxID=2991925 RepID=A0ABW6IH44_9CYAN
MPKYKVCELDQLSAETMQRIEVQDTPLLLTRKGDAVYAIAAHCTHLGAPLDQGVLSGDRVVCPWHNACFKATTGEYLEPPALDDLPCFETSIEAGMVWVDLPESVAQQQTPAMAAYKPEADQRVFVILGAGAAGNIAAETLRQEGFKGRVVLITAEAKLPYDRTTLSKKYLQSDSSSAPPPLRTEAFYKQHNIELWSDRSVTQVDAQAKTLTFSDGQSLSYDALLVATGGKARKLNLPGAELKNVFTLHQAGEASALLAAAQQAQTAVVLGSSFIGMEVAASLTQQGLKVTVVSRSETPFEAVLGKPVGQLFQHVHAEKGVTFKLGHKIERIEGDRAVEAVILDNGERLSADLVIIGVGIELATDMLTGVDLHQSDRSVPVDAHLQATDGLYAAGDIARFPSSNTGQLTRIEHWRLAQQQGRIAAKNMLGKQVPFASVPFFWTGQFDLKLRYVGHAEGWNEVLYHGDLEKPEFLAFYVEDEKVRAVAGINRDREIAAISELMRLQKMPSVETLRQGEYDWVGQFSP